MAPGRVNLIGEHVDYLGGLVLPCAVDRFIGVASSPSDEWDVRSDTAGGESLLTALARELETSAAQAAIAANLPVGQGLSSSASLLVAAAKAWGPELDGKDAALAAHRAEQAATGVMVGVMDQFASALGRRGEALLLNCDSLEYRYVPFPDDIVIAVIDSGVSRRLADTPYNERRAEAEAAVAEAGPPLLELKDPADNPRLRHVVSELNRVRLFVRALESGDHGQLGELLNESHRSLRDDFHVSIPQVDEIVERATSLPGCLGARIMGAGFGGSILALLEAGSEDAFVAAVDAPVLICHTSDGAYT